PFTRFSVAGEDHPVVDELPEPATLKRVNGDPFQREITMAEHAPDTGDDVIGLTLGLDVGVAAELQIDAPDIVRLLVQE
uniref:hypothetical protein n=1 Tax=Enterobacter hormaechei TaxID=158836 RepID=UPI0013D4D486